MSGPCARRRVICWIHGTHGEDHWTAYAQNSCDTPQETCPRLPGEGYEKCRTVCNQRGHAEVQAIETARSMGVSLQGAVAIVQGHTYACKECQEALYGAGVAYIRVEPELGSTAPQRWPGC